MEYHGKIAEIKARVRCTITKFLLHNLDRILLSHLPLTGFHPASHLLFTRLTICASDPRRTRPISKARPPLALLAHATNFFTKITSTREENSDLNERFQLSIQPSASSQLLLSTLGYFLSLTRRSKSHIGIGSAHEKLKSSKKGSTEP